MLPEDVLDEFDELLEEELLGFEPDEEPLLLGFEEDDELFDEVVGGLEELEELEESFEFVFEELFLLDVESEEVSLDESIAVVDVE